MFRILCALVVVFALCSAAYSEDEPERCLDENVVVSPVIIVASTVKAGDGFKQGDVSYTKYETVVTKALRAPADGPGEKATVSVFSSVSLKAGEEAILFLGAKTPNGYAVNLVEPVSSLPNVTALLALEARAEKELDGKDKLRAAFFYAHKLRPMFLAEALNKDVADAGQVPDADRDKLLSILGWALQEVRKKEATADFKQVAGLLRRVLSGVGGLPEYNTRDERLVQFWSQQLINEKLRAKYRLAKLTLRDKPVAAAAPGPGLRQPCTLTAATVVVVGGQTGEEVVAPCGIKPLGPDEKSPAEGTPPAPAAFGKVVAGLALDLAVAEKTYELKGAPGQAVKVTARFRNAGEAAIRLNTYMVFPLFAQIHIVDPAGKHSIYFDKGRLAGGDIPAMAPSFFKELKSGETMEFAEQIPASLFPKSGEYKLCVVYKNTAGKQFGIDDAWTGEAVSRQVTVKITVPGLDAPASQQEP